MELSGKKILFLGDSITAGGGTTQVDGEFPNRYTDVFQRMTGCEMYNYGVSGSRIAKQLTHELSWDSEDFVKRAELMNDEADVIVVFGGTNDYGHGDAPIGNFNGYDEYTFYGALHSLIIKLVSKYPDAYIMFMTPLHRLGENSGKNERGNPVQQLSEYVDVMLEVCRYYSIPVLDLYSTSGMQPEIPIIREKYMPDGLHPSDAGAYRIAQMLKNYLERV
ncbi:MAG: SGNH/GDSL hydrolase family protein [Clostridia bacterium]|nr:SGNH/GDSL hydrolase family protein [Clostridia bacterium]